MKNKRKTTLLVLTVLVMVAMLATLGLPVSAQQGNWWTYFTHEVGSSTTATLIAGQHTEVGTVTVWHDNDCLKLKYEIDENADVDIEEIHFSIKNSLGDIPQSPGGAIPGQFEFQESFDQGVTEYTWPDCLEPDGVVLSGTLYIAAHAALSDGETAWAFADDEETTGAIKVIKKIVDPCALYPVDVGCPGNPHEGVTFYLFKGEGEEPIDSDETDKDGIIIFQELDPGTDYYLVEDVPEGYKTDLDSEDEITVVAGQITNVCVINTPLPFFYIVKEVVDEDGNPVEGDTEEFTVRVYGPYEDVIDDNGFEPDADDPFIEVTISAEEETKVYVDEEGWYFVVETGIPNGYTWIDTYVLKQAEILLEIIEPICEPHSTQWIEVSYSCGLQVSVIENDYCDDNTIYVVNEKEDERTPTRRPRTPVDPDPEEEVDDEVVIEEPEEPAIEPKPEEEIIVEEEPELPATSSMNMLLLGLAILLMGAGLFLKLLRKRQLE